MEYDVRRLRREEFPWSERGDTIYLNHASTGPYPRRTVREMERWARLRTQPHRITVEEQFGAARTARKLAARAVGAAPEEIALFTNTSYGINLAARALPLAAGDTVLTFDREFPANIYPWMALEREGIQLERIPCRETLPDEDALHAALDRPGVRAVTVSWVSFATGYRVDLARLGAACRERGIWFVVDAIQGVGAATLDVHACNIDVLACGAQKWLLGPWGSGFAYVRGELVRRLEPRAVGWLATRASEDFERLVDYDPTWHDDARRFEVFTLPYQDFAGMNTSLALLHELGIERIERHVRGLVDIAVEWACAGGATLVTPARRESRAGVVALRPHGDARAASRRLEAGGVVHSLREGAIRLSPHCYNTAEEMRHALDLLGGAE